MGFQVGGMVNMQCWMMHQLNIEAKEIIIEWNFVYILMIDTYEIETWHYYLKVLNKFFKKVFD